MTRRPNTTWRPNDDNAEVQCGGPTTTTQRPSNNGAEAQRRHIWPNNMAEGTTCRKTRRWTEPNANVSNNTKAKGSQRLRVERHDDKGRELEQSRLALLWFLFSLYCLVM